MSVLKGIPVVNTYLGLSKRPFKQSPGRKVGQLVRVVVLQAVLQCNGVTGFEIRAGVAASFLKGRCLLRDVSSVVRSIGTEDDTAFLNLFKDKLTRFGFFGGYGGGEDGERH
jgi:hypothetical protein